MPASRDQRRITPQIETKYPFVPRKNAYPVPGPGIFDSPHSCVEINHDWRGFLVGVIDILTYDEFWTGDQFRARQEIEKLIAALTDDCLDEPTQDQVDQAQQFLGSDFCLEEVERCDMALQIQNIGGVPYLVENCCGGATRFFQLTDVTLDENGNPISVTDGGNIGDGFGSGSDLVVGDGNISCYGTAATDYLMERAIEWSEAVVDWSALGLDALLGLADEAFEAARLISDLISGEQDLVAVQGYTKQQISDALRDSAFQTTMADLWTFNDSPTRNELRFWVGDGPYFVNSVPVRLILTSWLDYSLVAGYSGDLLALATECETGNSIPTTFVTEEQLLALDGVDWAYVWDLRTNQFVEAAGEVVFNDPAEAVDWVDGTGYVAATGGWGSDNTKRIDFSVIGQSANGADAPLYIYADVKFVPDLGSNGKEFKLGTFSVDDDQSYDGTVSVGDGVLNASAGGVVRIDLHPDQANIGQGGTGTDGEAIVRQLAIAGQGNPHFDHIEFV